MRAFAFLRPLPNVLEEVLMRPRLLGLGLALAAATFFLTQPQPGLSYETYKDIGCTQCHGDFRSGTPNLHNVHRQQIMNNCDLCHNGGSSFGDVRTNASGVDGNLSCNGCHTGDGLRTKHAGLTAPDNNMCSDCHGAPGTPDPENVAPPFYARSDVNVKNPCLATGTGGEDFTGDGKGLDNDGDGSYDQDDSDCGTAVEEHPWGAIKSLFRRD